MKSVKCTALAMAFLIAISSISFSQNKNSAYPPDKYEIIEANYLVGLKSGNSGIKVSCAYFLGDMKSQKAVIPLMKMFREAEDDGAKLVAAWSLFKIGDPRGTFLVKRTIDLGECEQIRSMLFYLSRDFELKVNKSVLAEN